MAINLETIKQLIDEFTEKEAVTREEINVIQGQIEELEHLIITSQERLTRVTQDREKVVEMMNRYAENITPFPDSAEASTSIQDHASNDTQFIKPLPEKTTAADKGKGAKSSSQKPASGKASKTGGGNEPEAPEAQAEEGDNTVKSINDALRGLFK